MANRIFPLNRRQFTAGLGATVLGPVPRIATAQGRSSLMLRANPGVLALRPGEAVTPIWSLQGATPDGGLRFRRGDTVEVTLENGLPVPIALNWRGMDGVPAAEPLAARAPLAQGARETYAVAWRQAGTLLCDIRLLGDGTARPSAARSTIIAEAETVAVDRDEVLLFEDWRLRPDGAAIAAGTDPEGTASVVTVNGLATLDIPIRSRERLRLRLINGFQRNVIAVKIESHEVQVMAIDGQPAEPFSARNGALVLAPGGRVDAFIDATAPPGSTSAILLHDGTQARPIARLVTSTEPPVRSAPLPAAGPLPSNGLPERLDLRSALRVDVALGGPQADWVTPEHFAGSAAPAFRVKAGRIVVLALTNHGTMPEVFHLHGHHFRLLDRLDDGWKPFWLDTLAVEAGQTQRIAFSAEHAGRWLLEATATDWAAPRLVRWYSVE